MQVQMHRERRASAICDKPLNLPMSLEWWMSGRLSTAVTCHIRSFLKYTIRFLSAAFPRRNCSTLRTFSMKYEMHFISWVGLNKPLYPWGKDKPQFVSLWKMSSIGTRCSGSITLLHQQRKVTEDLKHLFPEEDSTLQVTGSLNRELL